MKNLYSVHGGEYLTGSHIEERFPNVNLWLPAKDTGIDLLVSDRSNRRTVSLQVKFSKDYLIADMKDKDPEFQQTLRACGWWTLNSDKMSKSPADYWVLVLQGYYNSSVDYVVIPPKELCQKLMDIHHIPPGGIPPKNWQVYLWVTNTNYCWETRDLSKDDQSDVAHDKFSNSDRDFKRYRDAWGAIELLNQP